MRVADTKSEVSRRLRKLREGAGWSQEELGFKPGMHRNCTGGIERGERNFGVENIAKLATALKIRPRDLLPRRSFVPFGMSDSEHAARAQQSL